MPNVFVARTFSKAHGMAGLRAGYAVGDARVIKALAAYKMPNSLGTLTLAAAMASIANTAHIEAEPSTGERRSFALFRPKRDVMLPLAGEDVISLRRDQTGAFLIQKALVDHLAQVPVGAGNGPLLRRIALELPQNSPGLVR